jgi:hypothetical protein
MLLARYSSLANISTVCFFVAVVVQNNVGFYFTLILNNIITTRATGHVLQDTMKDHHAKILHIFCYIFSLGVLMHRGDGGQNKKKETYPSNGVPRNFVWGGGSTNSVEDRGQRERGSGGSSPIVRGSGGSLIWYKKFHFI